MPTEAQKRKLQRYIESALKTEGQVVVDIDEKGGDTIKSFVYNERISAERIFMDIEDYFKNGERQVSDLMSFHTMYSEKVAGPYETKISNDIISLLQKYAYNISRQEYKILNSAVLENNNGKLYPNTLGLETTSNYLYAYYVDKTKTLHVFFERYLNEDDSARGKFAEDVANNIKALWYDSKGSIFADNVTWDTRKYRNLAEQIKSIARNKQREYLHRSSTNISKYSEKIGYHHGDLGKSEGRANFPHSTGHFGTGAYFFGSEDLELGYNSRNGSTPVEKIHMDLYHLYRPDNYRDGKHWYCRFRKP